VFQSGEPITGKVVITNNTGELTVGAPKPRVWKAASKAHPRQQQDWILRCLQGGRACHLAACAVAPALTACGTRNWRLRTEPRRRECGVGWGWATAQHSGVRLHLVGSVQMRLSEKAVSLFEAMFSNIQPISLVNEFIDVRRL
jgi:hypothetical protein